MSFFVYILESEDKSILYKGFTSDPEKRLYEHNQNLNQKTSGKGPLKLVYFETFEEKKLAILRIKQLKRSKQKSLNRLIENFNKAIP